MQAFHELWQARADGGGEAPPHLRAAADAAPSQQADEAVEAAEEELHKYLELQGASESQDTEAAEADDSASFLAPAAPKALSTSGNSKPPAVAAAPAAAPVVDSTSWQQALAQASVEDQQAAEFQALAAQKTAMLAMTAEQVALVSKQEELRKRLDQVSELAAKAKASKQAPSWSSVAEQVAELLEFGELASASKTANTTAPAPAPATNTSSGAPAVAANATASNSTANSTAKNQTANNQALVDDETLLEESNWEHMLAAFGGPVGGLLIEFGTTLWHGFLDIFKFIGWIFKQIGNFIHSSIVTPLNDGWHATGLRKYIGWLPAGLFWMAVLCFMGFCAYETRGAMIGAAVGFALGVVLYCTNLANVKIASVGVYLVFTGIVGFIYKYIFSYRFPAMRRMPQVQEGNWSFGLFDGFSCDPDPRILVCSLICMGTRWSDTVSARFIFPYSNFWVKLFIFGVLTSTITMTYGVSAVLLVAWLVWHRQTLRRAYMIPHGALTIFEDFVTYTFCAPCATMQEALQAEFINVPVKRPVINGPWAATTDAAGAGAAPTDAAGAGGALPAFKDEESTLPPTFPLPRTSGGLNISRENLLDMERTSGGPAGQATLMGQMGDR